MINADRIIASLIIISSLYFMWHAIALPIGWNGIEGGPGGGAFRFGYLSSCSSALALFSGEAVLGQSFKNSLSIHL